MHKIRFYKLAVFVALFWSLIPIAAALEQFSTDYNIEYTINQNSETLVNQKVKITNLKDDVTATSYSLQVKQMQIYEVSARDKEGEMEITQTTENDMTTIKALFNENVVGKDRSNEFTFSYKTKDIASKVGEVYNINIPKAGGLEIAKTYNITLNVPDTYGPKIFVSPQPITEQHENGQYILEFNKEILNSQGISASFGKYQRVNFKLIYQLQNDEIFATVNKLALPPDIPRRQNTSYKSILPEPVRVYEDADGNFMAEYVLKPKSRMEVEVIGSARLVGQQIKVDGGGKLSDIPKDIKETYTSTQKYWEVDAPEIQSLKNELLNTDENASQNAQKIYNFIVEHLKYDLDLSKKDAVERNGALKALTAEAPAACMEFTDLFIAMARAMGIPSRELNGYALSNTPENKLPLSIKLSEGDFLHAWPEYYDPNYGWVPVDPTWGNTSGLDYFTKLDNNHFVFVTKGLSSEQPLPAGTYHFSDFATAENKKNLVSVEFAEADQESDFEQYLVFKKEINVNPLQIFKKKDKYLVKNEGPTYIYAVQGEKLLPGEITSLYLDRGVSQIKYKNSNDEEKTQAIVYTKEKLRVNSANPPSKVIGTVISSIVIFGIGYRISKRKKL